MARMYLAELEVHLADEQMKRELLMRRLIREAKAAHPARAPIRLTLGRRLISLGARLAGDVPVPANDRHASDPI